jgi:hypothetical protein
MARRGLLISKRLVRDDESNKSLYAIGWTDRCEDCAIDESQREDVVFDPGPDWLPERWTFACLTGWLIQRCGLRWAR